MNICSKIEILAIVCRPTVKTLEEFYRKSHNYLLESEYLQLKEYFELFAKVKFTKGYGECYIELRRFDPDEFLFVMGGINVIEKYRSKIHENNDELGIYCYKKYIDTLPDELKLLLEVYD